MLIDSDGDDDDHDDDGDDDCAWLVGMPSRLER
jgi:hypothetical protein